MKICKNCKFYEPYTDNTIYHKKCGLCNCEKFIDANTQLSDYYEKQRESGTLRYWDYESYSCGFDVQEQFGCINFKDLDKEVK